MITVCHPRDDLEQLFIVSLLEEADIPYFIVGQNFGSLYPGIQIPWYNQRSIRVPSSYVDFACEVIEGFRATYVGPSENIAARSKLRMLLEVWFLGWIVPGGKKRSSTQSTEVDQVSVDH